MRVWSYDELIDTHSHLNLEQFDCDLDEVLREAQVNGVHQVIVSGIDFFTSRKSIEQSIKYEGKIYSTVGIHPNYAKGAEIEKIEELIQKNSRQIHAIGEIGLDFFRDYAPKDIQIEVFDKQLNLSEKYQLPICLHNRDADKTMIEMLNDWCSENLSSSMPSQKGVFHAFSGSENIAEWGISHAFNFGIGGYITYKNSSHLREIIKSIGIDRLVLETDAPYLSPVPFRGKRNTPKNIIYIVEALSEIFNLSLEEIEQITDKNARLLFNLNKNATP